MSSLKVYLGTLNLFRPADGAEQQDEHQQRTSIIATRVYLILLFLILVFLLLATSLSPLTISIKIENPMETQFESLPDPTCPCSRIALSYADFVSMQPSFHKVCSSDFVSDRWISSLFYGANSTRFLPIDIRSSTFAQFQALASFCQLSQANVFQSLTLFGYTSFISSGVLSKAVFQSQVKDVVDRLQLTTANTFRTQVQLISNVTMSNQFMNGLGTSVFPSGNSGVMYNIYLQDGGWCSCTEVLVCPGPSGIYNQFDVNTLGINDFMAILRIPGLTNGCMPVDACLQSSLECFFNQSCVDSIVPYLSTSDKNNFTAMVAVPSSRFDINSTVTSIVDKLMVEDWRTNVSYGKYYAACAPLSCTYSTTARRDFLYILTTLIGLLGGLCAGLGVVVPAVVSFIRQRPTIEATPHISFIDRVRRLKPLLKRVLIELNLFQIYPSNHDQVHQQRIATRLYIALLSFAVVMLVFYLFLSPEIYRETVKQPSQSHFSYLQSLYPTSLNCPCSTISITYNVFVTIEPRYHQMCSSDFVSSLWLAYLAKWSTAESSPLDFTALGYSHFHILATFCAQALITITQALQLFLQQEFVTSQVVSENLFKFLAGDFIQDWQVSTVNNFRRTLQLVRVIGHGNHLGAAFSNLALSLSDSGEFMLDSVNYYGENCTCTLSALCLSPISFYDATSDYFSVLFTIPGFFAGCFQLDGMLASTLECFYSQRCLDTVVSYVSNDGITTNFTILNASRNPANETINSAFNQLFVDEWSSNTSFSAYYQACSPSSCTFEYTRRRNFLSLVISIIGVFGGLTTGLKILFFILLRLVANVRRDRSFRAHLRSVQIWFMTLYNQEHLASRLHIVLLTTTLAALYLSSVLTMQSRTEQIPKPSLEIYEKLFLRYPTTVQCPCSHVSIQYQSFMNLTVTSQHQVCSSDFVSDKWIATLLLPGHQSDYSPFEFRNGAPGHFQLLASLCQTTQNHINDAIFELVTGNFISSHAISSTLFHEQIQTTIDQFQITTPNTFLTILQLVRDMISDNTLITLFETNWKWLNASVNPSFGKPVHTKPIIYGNCNCGLSSQCTQPAIVLDNNNNNKFIPGLMVGCYPLESLLKSTLACFYDALCFPLLQTLDGSFRPLNISLPSRYQVNSTVESILSRLMVEQLLQNVSYESYYGECDPLSCSYSYLAHPELIEIIANLLGLYGGLVIIVKVVVPMLLASGQRIVKCRRRNQIHMIVA